jgi:heptosyltransferase-2
MWIGDFVRGHTVVYVLKARGEPAGRPVPDAAVRPLSYICRASAPIIADLPRSRLAVRGGVWHRTKVAGYATALVLPRTWSDCALRRYPRTVELAKPARAINWMRWARGPARFIDKNAASRFGTPRALPPEWPYRSWSSRVGKSAAGADGLKRLCSGAGARFGRLWKRKTYYPEGAAFG